MSRRPTANGHQSQEDEGQQRSADDTYEVASSPQLARRCQSVSHDRDPQPARANRHSGSCVLAPSKRDVYWFA